MKLLGSGNIAYVHKLFITFVLYYLTHHFPKEIWKQINGFNGYSIINLRRIYTLKLLQLIGTLFSRYC